MFMLTDEILKYQSVSIVGLAKNTGKTECMNYILSKLKDSGRNIALTSVGVDGESIDIVTRTPKPEIKVYQNMLFVTSEKHYREKRVTADIMDVGESTTALGRLVIARAVNSGKVLLSGPATTTDLKDLIDMLLAWRVHTVIVDGALSRMSPASPVVTDAMVLATGAAVSGSISQLVYRTKYVYDRICLPCVYGTLVKKLSALEKGVWAIDGEGEVHDLDIASVFLFKDSDEDLFRYGRRFYVAGAVGDKFLDFLRAQREPSEVIVRDFTRIFSTPEGYYAFFKRGGTLSVLSKNKLLGICINPQSPDGYCLDSEILQAALEQVVDVPVIDVRRLD